MEKKARKRRTPPAVDVAEINQAEVALRAALERAAWLARFPSENPNPVVRASAEGTILYCNPAAVKNDEWACKEGEPLRGPILRHVAPAMAKGEEIYAEIQLGTCFYAVTYVPFPAESYVNIYGRNITERKQAENALLLLNAELEERVAAQTAEIRRTCAAVESERQRFYDVLEMLPVYVILLTADYRVPFANRFFRERFGEAQGKRCYEYLFQRTEPCEICETYTVLKTGKPHHWEWIGPDGRDYDVHDFPFTDDDGARLILEMGIDVTEIKRVQAALREANETLERRVIERTAQLEAARAEAEEGKERLKLFIEHAPAALAMFDREMRYLSVSRRWRSTFNLGDGELLGASHYDILPEISSEWREDHRRGLAGEVLRPEASRFERADGSVQWLRREIRPWTDAAGALGGIVIFVEDITERRLAQEALENRSKQLEDANRELEDFSYTISHDLRAPLRAIDGYSRMILRKHADKLDEDALEKFNVIRENTLMMGQLIEDLLAFSRLGRAQLSKAPLDIEQMLRETWEELIVLNPDRRMTLKIGRIPPGRGDRGLIKQVLINILANAVKFTRGREEALIEAGGYSRDGEIVYWVRDNGVGFDMQYHDKLFGVFQRLHSADEFEGTGVGLAIVQRIIHRHGGRIWAEGEIDRGACFYFSLPR